MKGKPARPQVDILGCPVDRVALDGAVSMVEALITAEGAHQVVVLSVPQLMEGRRDRRLFDVWSRASIVLPDGVPLLWASRILGAPIPGRVAGADLFWALSRLAEIKGYACFLLGSTTEVVERLQKVLLRRFPFLRVAGSFAPPRAPVFSAAVNNDIIQRVNAARPDILWVGLGAPRQELWIHDTLAKLDTRLAIGVGAAFDMCSGSVRRAPRWMQRAGLEWFYRFLLEPRRLFRRYFIDSAPFLPLVLWQRVRRALPLSLNGSS
jgi:N-acetylglucosaminyldiphosphoundecaprenol N-acetyl-beta-D-mannosaminyltransferase